MDSDVKKYCHSCTNYQRHKTHAPNPKNRPLKPSLPYAINARLGVDLIGPLPLTTDGNQYSCVIIDYFSKMSAAVPIQNKEAMTVAEALFKHWYLITFQV